MALPRQGFIPIAVTTLVLWSSDLYAVNKLLELEVQEQNPNVKKFLGCLIAFKSKLKDNNPAYDNPQVTADVNQFLEQLDQLINNKEVIHHAEFMAAVYNLKGLAQTWLKRDIDAQTTFVLALESTTNPLSKAILYSNLGYVFEDNALLLKYHKLAETFIREADSHKTTNVMAKQNVAAVYAGFGYAYRKTDLINNAGLAETAYELALKWWPLSNVIANRRAILLSKLNDEAALMRAEGYFAKVYDYAKANSQFVVPYYRADVIIKLAGIYVEQGLKEKPVGYIQSAQEYLECAETALKVGNYADVNGLSDYQNKGLARLHRLKGRLAAVQGNLAQAQAENEAALKHRAVVKEEQAVKDKFETGLVKTDSPFVSAQVFFRYKLLTASVGASSAMETGPRQSKPG